MWEEQGIPPKEPPYFDCQALVWVLSRLGMVRGVVHFNFLFLKIRAFVGNSLCSICPQPKGGSQGILTAASLFDPRKIRARPVALSLFLRNVVGQHQFHLFVFRAAAGPRTCNEERPTELPAASETSHHRRATE